MARSHIETLLPLDDYARIMAIPGWVFNQVDHPNREYHGVCSDPIYQSGYGMHAAGFVGRDEIARAIATAEENLARYAGFWPSCKWICADEVEWPVPKRGTQTLKPILKTAWGYIVAGGVEAYELEAGHQEVVYSDEDDDGYLDTGTITVSDMYSLYEPYVSDKCEVAVVPEGRDPETAEWRIRPLDISIADDGTITISGPIWMFVDPDEWYSNLEAIQMDDADRFLSHVDIYRHYNDESHQARIIWNQYSEWETCDDVACDIESQNGCISIKDPRVGQVTVTPATYAGGSGVWSSDDYANSYAPTHVRMWYQSGYDNKACRDCFQMGEMLKLAVVRLANVYLPDTPCGCDITQNKWREDREELPVSSFMRALTERRLGTTARGAVFAMSTMSSLEPLGKGG